MTLPKWVHALGDLLPLATLWLGYLMGRLSGYRRAQTPTTETEPMARRGLTPEQYAAFVVGGCAECPRCGHDNFEEKDLEIGEHSETGEALIYRNLVCEECAESITVNYTLTPESAEST